MHIKAPQESESPVERAPLAHADFSRVVIVGGHTILRAGLKLLFAQTEAIAVVGDAAGRSEALAMVEKEQPDLILLDLDGAGGHGVDLIAEFAAVLPSARILVLTGNPDREVHRRAVRLGAIGLMDKDKPPGMLIKAIERIHAGEVWLDRSLTASLIGEISRGAAGRDTRPEASQIGSLTDREREVIDAVGAGMKNKQIANLLFISEVTVRHHLTSIYSKLDVSSRLELIIYAYRHGLAQLPR